MQVVVGQKQEVRNVSAGVHVEQPAAEKQPPASDRPIQKDKDQLSSKQVILVILVLV